MTYEYVCTACHHQWEADQSIREAALTECPACGKSAAKRQVSGGTGFVLKGGGWYSDLYASAKPSSEASKPETKSETKPAETTSTASAAPAASPAPSASAPTTSTAKASD